MQVKLRGKTSYRQTKPVSLVEARIQASDKCTCRKQQRLLDPRVYIWDMQRRKTTFFSRTRSFLLCVYIYPQDDRLGWDWIVCVYLCGGCKQQDELMACEALALIIDASICCRSWRNAVLENWGRAEFSSGVCRCSVTELEGSVQLKSAGMYQAGPLFVSMLLGISQLCHIFSSCGICNIWNNSF